MWPASGPFLDALPYSQSIVTKVEAWRAGQLLGLIDISEGHVDVTARNRVRRTCELVVPSTLWPVEPTDMLAPYGTYLRCYRGIDLGSGPEYVPVFHGRVQTVDDRDQFGDAGIDVHAVDLMADVNDARFESPRAGPTGTSIISAITTLITEAVPDAGIVVDSGVDTTSVVPSGMLWDQDRGKAIDDLAQAIGAEVFAGPDGGFRIRNVPTIDDPAVWSVAEGVAGTLVTAGRSLSREGVYNVVVTVVERANGDLPLRFVAADSNPTSPTYVGGVFGRVPRFLRNPLVTSTWQAEAAGLALLARSIGATRTRTVSCVPNPCLDAGDVLSVVAGGVTETHIADTLTLPLHADGGAMTIGTRSTKPDAGDL
jgi:hypothetical protein